MDTPIQTGSSRVKIRAAALCVAVAAALAYANSFDKAFVYDDVGNIIKSSIIVKLWPPWDVLFPPSGSAIGGRGVVNLSLAVNYAISGLEPWSYHVFNLIFHVCAALVLFGLLRRIFSSKRLARYGPQATGLAWACALLWAVHPLQTESVTYISQRCESVGSLFFLLTLYCAARGWESPTRPWQALSVAAFILGVGSKEMIVAAPLCVFFYDLVFVHEKAGAALKASRGMYAGFVLGWVLLAVNVASGATYTVTARPWCGPFEYLINQPRVLALYLKLAVWPDSLCLDYSWPLEPLARLWPYLVVFSALFLATGLALWRRHPLGFVGAWFFLILAPSSSFKPMADLAVEHRMYLPLASVIVLVVLGAFEAGQKIAGPSPARRKAAGLLGAALVLAAALGLGARTLERNQDYADPIRMWADVARQRPQNPRAPTNLGMYLAESGRVREAKEKYRRALAMEPGFVPALFSFGNLLSGQGAYGEAAAYYRKALAVAPDYCMVHVNLAVALDALGKRDEAMAHYRKVLELAPDFRAARYNLANMLTASGNFEEAVVHYRRFLALKPDMAPAHFNLGVALDALGRPAEAAKHFKQAADLDPSLAEARQKFADCLAQARDWKEAERQYREFLRLRPGSAPAHVNLGVCLTALGRTGEAAESFKEALRLDPGNAFAKRYLESSRAGK